MKVVFAVIIALAGCATDPSTKAGEDNTDLDTSIDSSDTSGIRGDSGAMGDSGDALTPSHCERGTNPGTISNLTCIKQAACTWAGDQDYASRGYALDVGGDVNGDGWPDLVVGAPTEDIIVEETVIGTDSGAVHVWLNVGKTSVTAPSGTIYGPISGGYLGYSVAIAPDINGDGLDDIIAGGRGNSASGILAGGTAMLLLGRADDWDTDMSADHTWTGETLYGRVGSHVQGTEDLNGDGLGELLIATDQKQVTSGGYETIGRGRVAIIFGTADITAIASLDEPDAAFEGAGAMDGAGTAFTTGDLNGDGHLEVIIGSPYGDSNRGRVDIIQGQAEPIGGTYTTDLAHLSLKGTSGSGLGYALSTGDLNADGLAELGIGAPADDLIYDSAGSVSVFTGSADLFSGIPEPAARLHGEFDDTQLGSGVHLGGDLNGDGVGDILVGAIYARRGLISKGGRVYGLHGPHTGWEHVTDVATAPVQIFGAATKDYLGRASVSIDINDDGKAEIFSGTGFSNGPSTYDAGSVSMFWGE